MARILVVDDDSAVAMAVAKMLKYYGHQVDYVFSIGDALICVGGSEGQQYDLLVTDCNLVPGTWFDLINRGRSECPSLFPRRVLVMSGQFPDDTDYQMAALCEWGFIPFRMNKPVVMFILNSFVSCLLSLQPPPAVE